MEPMAKEASVWLRILGGKDFDDAEKFTALNMLDFDIVKSVYIAS